MSALKIKDAQGNWIEVPMIKGDKGDKGEQGDTYELTEQDKQDIADLVEVPEPLKYVKDDPSNNFSVIEGSVSGADANVATGAYSHAEGLATKALGYASHSEGNGTQAKNSYSHAEGYNNISSADYTHSEGVGNTASGTASHSEGNDNVVSGLNSHVEGVGNLVTGSASHAEGADNEATNYASHVEGQGNHATGYYSHSEGYGNRASGTSSHAEGEDTEVISGANASHVEGKGTLAITSYQHAQGKYNNPSYDYAFIIGNGSSKSNRSNAMTVDWNGNGVYAGKLTVGTAPTNDMDVATKKYVDDVKGASIHICSSAEYDSTTRVPTIQNPDEKTFYLVPSEDGTSPDLFVEWVYVNGAWEMFGSASIDLSGYLTDVTVNGISVVTDGIAEIPEISAPLKYIKDDPSDNGGVVVGHVSSNTASGWNSYAEGGGTTASATCAHAEGAGTRATGGQAHSEGGGTLASGNQAHAEGASTTASGDNSHAENLLTTASGACSHASGINTIAQRKSQFVIGELNVVDTGGSTTSDKGDYILIAGNGTTYSNRSNAMTLDWSGNEKLAGSLTLGMNTQDETTISASELKELKEMNPVEDVQINGVSIVYDGTANIPIGNGIQITNGAVSIVPATSARIKQGVGDYTPIVSATQNKAVFYGLAKASGDTTQSQSNNAVGTYTDEAKTAIKQMLGVVDSYDSLVVNVTGTDPVITAQPSYRYNCGEVTTLTITPPSSGTIDFIFTSGTTPTVLDLPSTVKMPSWWIGVEANTTYEMCITDGVYCGVMSWDA